MKKDEKVWASIFKLEGLKCACGDDLKVHYIKNLGKKYLLLRATEDNKKSYEFYFLYDKEKRCVVSPGGFYLQGDKGDKKDPAIQNLIQRWEKKGKS